MLDDFERSDENPIRYPWTIIDGTVQILSGILRGTHFPPTGDEAYWTPDTFVVSGAADIEVWGVHDGFAALSDASRIGIYEAGSLPDAKTGYQILTGFGVGGNFWNLRRYENGVPTTEVSLGPPIPGGDDIVLLRKIGALVETFISQDGGDNWTLRATLTDPSPFSGPWKLFLGTTGVETGWKEFGGGVIHRTQIYRYVSN